MRLSARIGAIEIAEDTVRIAVVKTGLRLPKVLKTVEVPVLVRDDVDLHEAQVAAVREAAAQLKSPPPVYVLSIPSTWCTIRLLKVPFRGKRKIASAAPFELEPFLAIPIEELVVDFLVTRSVDGGSRVLAIAVQRSALEERCAVLEEAGISVDGAILDAVSMTALWDAVRVKSAGAHAVLHLREGESVLAVVEGRKLTYLRRLTSSAGALRSGPAAVGRELRNILRARAADGVDESPVQSLTVTVSGLPEADCALFEDEIDIPVRYQVLAGGLEGVDPDVSAGYSVQEDDVTGHVNRWVGPIAAACSAAGGPFHMNFLKEQFSSASTRRTLANYAVATCLSGVFVLLGFLGLVYADHRTNLAHVDQLGQAVWEEFAATYPDVATERPKADVGGSKSFEFMQLATDEEGLTTSTLSREKFSRPTLLDVLSEIGSSLPDSIATIEDMKIAGAKKWTITISGQIKDSIKFNESIKALETSKVFTIDTGRLRRTSAGGIETFVLTASI